MYPNVDEMKLTEMRCSIVCGRDVKPIEVGSFNCECELCNSPWVGSIPVLIDTVDSRDGRRILSHKANMQSLNWL